MVRKCIAIALLGFALCACRENPEKDAPGQKQFTCELEQTKTALSGQSVIWSQEDKIKVYSATCQAGEVFTLAGGEGTSAASFTGTQPGAAPYVAVYPGDMAQRYVSSSEVGLTLPGEQEYCAGGFAPGSNPAVAFAEGDNLAFRNACGLLAIRMTGSASVTRLVLTDLSGAKIWGSGSVSADDGCFVRADGGVGDDTLTLTCPAPVQLGEEPTAFYFVLPAGSLGEGFSLKIVDADGGAMNVRGAGNGANAIARSTICAMPVFAYQVNESAFLSEGVYGVYDLASGTPVAVKAYVAGSDQVALRTAASTATFRIQNLAGAWALSISVPRSLQPGQTCSLAVSSIGTTGVADATVNAVLVKSEGGKCWLEDKEHKVGYIIAESL